MSLADIWNRAPAAAKRATLYFGAVAAIAGAVTAGAAAWPIVEPYLVAHRGYVLEHVGDVRTTTNELLIWKSEDQKNALSREQRSLNILLKKEQDEELKQNIQHSIEKSAKEESLIDARIKKLKGK